MLQPDLTLQVQLLAETSQIPDLFAGDRVAGVARLQPSPPVMARVQAQLPNGRFSVLIGQSMIEMDLPATTRPGQDIRLAYAGTGPEPEFAAPPATATADSKTEFSSAGRLLASLATEPDSHAALVGIAAATPLLEAAPANAGQIDNRLRQALSSSGLFYESHQAKWAAGDFPLELLLMEPQAKLTRLAANAAVSPGSADLYNDRSDVRVAAGGLPGAAPESPAAAGAPAHPQTLPFIQHQLAVLETGHIVWQGQLWPGQWMHWDIAELERGPDGDPGQETAGWETCVGLEMPLLGAVEANLRINRGKISVRLKSADADAQTRLRKHLPELAAALGGAGLSVESIKVDPHVV